MKKRTVTVNKLSLRDAAQQSKHVEGTPAERIGMMWQLAMDAWAFTGDFDAESRLPRHVVRVVRRGR